jgi:hypothetical protein
VIDFLHGIGLMACGFFWGAAFEMWRYRKERRAMFEELARIQTRVRIIAMMDAILKPGARA